MIENDFSACFCYVLFDLLKLCGKKQCCVVN